MKFLIVDDDDMIRVALRHAIGRDHDEIIECTDGAQAVEAYEKHRPDWVLMDIMMEPMDGLTATAKIKERFPNARIIILTSHDQKEFEDASRRLGAVKFLHKDNFAELKELLKY